MKTSRDDVEIRKKLLKTKIDVAIEESKLCIGLTENEELILENC